MRGLMFFILQKGMIFSKYYLELRMDGKKKKKKKNTNLI